MTRREIRANGGVRCDMCRKWILQGRSALGKKLGVGNRRIVRVGPHKLCIPCRAEWKKFIAEGLPTEPVIEVVDEPVAFDAEVLHGIVKDARSK